MSTLADMLVQARAWRARGAWQEVEDFCRQALAIDGSSDEAQRLLGDAQRGQGRLEQALIHYAEAVRLNPRAAKNHTALAVALVECSRFDQAIQELELAGRLDPGDAESHRQLQIVLAAKQNQQGLQLGGANRIAEAEVCFSRAVELNPNNAQAWQNWGVALERLDRLDEAVAAYGRALALQPQYVQAHQNLGVVLARLERYAEAEASHRRALALNPEFAPAHNGLGVALEKQNRLAESEAAFARAVALAPGFAEAYSNLAAVQESQNKLDEALVSFRQALELNPHSFEAHFNFAQLLKRKRKFKESILWHRQAVELNPQSVDAHLSLGNLYRGQNLLSEAELHFRRVIEMYPQSADTFCLLAEVLAVRQETAAANEAIQQALALDPDSISAHNLLAYFQMERGSLRQAMADYEALAGRNPTNSAIRMNYGFVLLTSGDLARGWSEYEFRLKTEPFDYLLRPQPRWSGESLAGKAILVQEEQGLGDTMQCIRYAPALRQRGAKVFVVCRPPLVSLVARTEGIDAVIRKGDVLPAFDYYVNTLSLPHLFGTTLENIPAPIPYLNPDPQLVDRWRNELAPVRALKVGIAWQGDTTNEGDSHRSFPLAQYEGISHLPGLQLYSLQFGFGREQLANWQGNRSIIDLGDRLGDFASTAAIVRNLDLVITCDSALGHLAGGLGVPVWLPLTFVPDWRWMLHRSDSPWYPSMRLFRQSVRDQWPAVFADIEQDLAAILSARR